MVKAEEYPSRDHGNPTSDDERAFSQSD